ncbi:MAG TPA: DUF6600 domain-containing protein, partial [Kofleriaceae bacterium]|nr:DUF6600 domain-containing protein [Kofleriaceae bacterium]
MRRTILSLAILAMASAAGRQAAAQTDDDGSLPPSDSPPADSPPPDSAPVGGAEADLGDDAQYDDPGYDEPAYDDTAPDEAIDEGVAGSVDESYADDSSGESAPPAPTDAFHDTLAPYGRWVRTAEFGLVWVPSRSIVGSDFVPYGTGGSWRYSDAGWLFASDWDWGWAPFHYGRWYRQYPYGWVWVPGNVWAPAWVDWRYGDGFIGWAPLPPRGYRVTRRDHRNWYFCSYRDIGRPHIQRYWVRSSPRIWHRTAWAHSPVRHGRARWFGGPRPEQIERVTRTRVPRVHIVPPRAGVLARLRIQGDRSRLDPIRHRQRFERRQFESQRQQQAERQRQNQFERERQRQAERQRQNQFDRQRQQQAERQRQNQFDRQRQNQFDRQ